jgi:hypothetical protein
MQAQTPAQAPQAHATPQPDPAARLPAMWAIVELFGHQRIAGQISEQAFGGGAMVRVDVPQITVTETAYVDDESAQVTRTIPAHTRSFGTASIYSINWCDEVAATLAARTIKHEPLRPYSLRAAMAGMPEGERQRLLALTAGSACGGDDLPF